MAKLKPNKKPRRRRLSADTTCNLLKCPFCGSVPTMQPWHGGKWSKVLIGCESDECEASPSVTGETPIEAAVRWNLREPAYNVTAERVKITMPPEGVEYP